MSWSSNLELKWLSICTLGIGLACTGISAPATCAAAEAAPIAAAQSAAPASPGSKPDSNSGSKAKDQPKAESHITPDEAKQLFALVDQLLKFSSDEPAYPSRATLSAR